MRALIVAFVLLAAGAAIVPPGTPGGTDCGRGSTAWSAPQRVAHIPPGRTLRWPSLVAVADTTIVAANLLPTDPTALLDARPFALFRIPGGTIPAPPGPFTFALPKGAASPGGAYHLVWAEPDTESRHPFEWRAAPVRALWHARFDGIGWSEPERILAGDRIDWPAEEGAFVVDSDGRPHLIVSAAVTPGAPRVQYLSRHGGSWVRKELSEQGATYGSIVAPAPDSLVVAFVALVVSDAGSATQVTVLASGDGGGTWSSPIPAAASVGPRAPRLVHGPTGLHLLWVEVAATPPFPMTVRHRLSRDGGLTWTDAGDTPFTGAGQLLRFNAAGTPDAGLRVVVETLSADGTLRLAELAREADAPVWSDPFPQFLSAGNAGLVADRHGFRLVFDAVAEPGGAARTWWSGCGLDSEPPPE